MMSEPIGALPSVAAVQAAPTKIADLLTSYSSEAASIARQPRLPVGASEAEQLTARTASTAQLAALKQQTIADLERLEHATGLALADARERLETAILPVMSTDPQVQRVFELRQATALA